MNYMYNIYIYISSNRTQMMINSFKLNSSKTKQKQTFSMRHSMKENRTERGRNRKKIENTIKNFFSNCKKP